jgi:hypothetical protein
MPIGAALSAALRALLDVATAGVIASGSFFLVLRKSDRMEFSRRFY